MSDADRSLEIQIEEDDRGRTARIAGELSLATVERLRQFFLERLEPGARVVADCSGVTEIDLSGLQILCSAHRTYTTRGATFEMSGRSEPLLAAARSAGYSGRPRCRYRQGDCCLW